MATDTSTGIVSGPRRRHAETRLRLAGTWALVAGLIAVGLVASVDAQALRLLIGGSLAIAIVFCALARPKFFVGAAVLTVLFSTTLEQATHVPHLKAAGAAVAIAGISLLPCARIASGRALRAFPGWRWFAAFAVLGILSSAVHHVPPLIAAEGGFLALKGVWLGFCVAQVDWTTADVQRIARVSGATLVFILVCCIANELAPQAWVALVSPTETTGVIRLGLYSLIGPFIHPGVLGQIAALATIAVVAYRQVVGPGRHTALLAIAAGIAAVLSVRRRAINGLIAGLVFVFLRHNRTRTLFALALLVPTTLILTWSQITAVVANTQAQYLGQNQAQIARTVMYRDSVKIASEMFPFGAGFGRYGTDTAIVHYSPVYWQLGFQKIYGLTPASYGEPHGAFGSDTYWPGVLGETGVLGLVAMSAGLIAMWRRFYRYSNNVDPWVQWLGLVGVGWSVEYLVESVASPDYIAAPVYPLLFALGGLAVAVASSSHPPASDAWPTEDRPELPAEATIDLQRDSR